MISLGINYSHMHDSSACIARDGEVIFAIAEERLSRRKHDESFPLLGIQACLDFAGVRSDDVDYVCAGWPHTEFGGRARLEMFGDPGATGELHERGFVAEIICRAQLRGETARGNTRSDSAAPRRVFVLWIITARMPSAPTAFPDSMTRPCWFLMAAALGKPPRSGTGATDASNTSGQFHIPIPSVFSMRSLLSILASLLIATNGK